VRAEVAVRLPNAFADADAAPLLCGGVVGHRALRLAGVPGLADDAPAANEHRSEPFRLGLYGFGASASLVIQEAVHLGCVVHVASRSAQERERAVELGAASTGGYAEPPAEPLDAAITFAPVGSVVVFALHDLAPGGTVVINAIHLDQIPAFPYPLLWEERGLRSVANVTHRDAVEFLELAAAIPIRTVVRPYPLTDANAALADLAAGQIGAAEPHVAQHAERAAGRRQRRELIARGVGRAVHRELLVEEGLVGRLVGGRLVDGLGLGR